MDKDTIWVVTGESIATRGSRSKPLKVDELSVNINLFLEQMGGLLEKTPEKLGKFHFEEFEIYAEVTGKGILAILDTGCTGYIGHPFPKIGDFTLSQVIFLYKKLSF